MHLASNNLQILRLVAAAPRFTLTSMLLSKTHKAMAKALVAALSERNLKDGLEKWAAL